MLTLAVYALVFIAVMPTIVGLTLLGAMSTRARLVRTVAIAAELVFGWIVVPWAWFGMAGRWVVVLTTVIAVAVGWIHGRPPKPSASSPWGDALAALAFVAMAIAGLAARIPPRATLELQFPLRGGSFVVLHGGANVVMNQHARSVAGQRAALDIAKLGAGARKASGLVPSRLEGYAIFGEPLYAPCSGEVVAAEGSWTDHAPGTDFVRLGTVAGNYVMLACGGNTILLAHLQGGSVTVRVGSQLVAGDPLGRVGNTGNSTEPHLHIHAVHGVVRTIDEVVDSASPVAITLGGRYLVRNDVVRDRAR